MTDIADGRGIHVLGADTGLLPGHDWQWTLTSAAIVLLVSTLPILLLGKYKYGTERHGSPEREEPPAA
jgi:hypothetical protein